MKKEQYLKMLGKHIRQIRRKKRLSQSDLAKKCYKDQQSIQRLEAGKINPSVYYLIEIANGLEVEVHELLHFDYNFYE